jgi:serine/threonine protein phosphatase PrpC
MSTTTSTGLITSASSTTIPATTGIQTTTGLIRNTHTTGPCGMAFDPSGNIYVSYPLENCIYKQNELYIISGIELNTPLGLCYVNNTLYIANWGNSRIVTYNGTTSTTITMPIQPYGLCSIGNILYISGQDSIYRYDTRLTLIKQNSGSDFMFMCTDGVILYICDNTSKSVRQYNMQTNVMV